MLYYLGSLVTKDAEWKLEEDEADELSKRTLKLFKTLDKKKLEKIEKRFAKYVPAFGLVASVATITYPRIQSTLAKRKVQRVVSQAEAQTNGNGRAPGPVASGSNHAGQSPDGYRPGAGGANRSEPVPPTPLVSRPIRHSDLSEISLGDEPE